MGQYSFLNLLRVAVSLTTVGNRYKIDSETFTREFQDKLDQYSEKNNIEPIKITNVALLPDELVISVTGGGVDSSWELQYEVNQDYSEFLQEFNMVLSNTIEGYLEGPI